MGTLFGFVVGYLLGARAGSEGYQRLTRAWSDIRQSPEFRDFLGVVREHAQTSLRVLSDRLDGDVEGEGQRPGGDVQDLIDEARARMAQRLDPQPRPDQR